MKEYVFVRGFQKSGRNWVKNILNLHPRIICRGEYHFAILSKGIESFINVSTLNQNHAHIVYRLFENLVTDYLEFDNRNQNVTHFGDCSPWDWVKEFAGDSLIKLKYEKDNEWLLE